MSEPNQDTQAEIAALIAAVDVRAPERLHERVQALVDERTAGRARSRWSPVGGLKLGTAGVALVVVVLVLVLSLSGSAGGGLTLKQASALTLEPATMPAPSENMKAPKELTAAVEGIPYPYWSERFGWRSAGARTDRVAGRTVSTVFYVDGKGRRVGYAIVAGTPAPRIAAGTVTHHHGTDYLLTRLGGNEVVTWVRHGHLCVVSGRGVSGATLLALAGWDDRAI
jgi:hypothetical protein